MFKIIKFITFMFLCLLTTPCFAESYLVVENTGVMNLGKIVLSQKESSAKLDTTGSVDLTGAFVQGTHIKNAGILSFIYNFDNDDTPKVVMINEEIMPTATIEGDGCTIKFSNFIVNKTSVILTPDNPSGNINIGATVEISGFCKTDTYKGSINIPYNLADETGVVLIDDIPDATLQVMVETDNPIEVSVTENMNFGTIISPTTAGTVVLAPDGKVTSDNVTMLSNSGATAGQAVISAVAGRSIQVSVSAEILTIKTSDNKNSMIVSKFTFSPSSPFNMPSGSGMVDQILGVGATLNVGANQPAGNYTGSFTVNLTYE